MRNKSKQQEEPNELGDSAHRAHYRVRRVDKSTSECVYW